MNLIINNMNSLFVWVVGWTTYKYDEHERGCNPNMFLN